MKRLAGRIACSIVLALMAMMLGAPSWAAFIGGMLYGCLMVPERA